MVLVLDDTGDNDVNKHPCDRSIAERIGREHHHYRWSSNEFSTRATTTALVVFIHLQAEH
jgi:hypothetical protein